MKQFHGNHKKHSFFEGWYLKHQQGPHTISLIPAFHIDSAGASSASIQIITPDYTGCVPFSSQQLLVNPDRFSIQIEKNHFSDTGIDLNLHTDDFYVRGSLSYGPLTVPEEDIMGPFRHLPFMQCNHGVLSLAHSLSGTLDINGTATDFTDGIGYIEKDWGHSFPSSYLWTQGNWLSPSGSPCCVMLAIAHIPMPPAHFTGCICSVYYEGKEYRLATYHHAVIKHWKADGALIKQGKLRLLAEPVTPSPRPLYAPNQGAMKRIIHESVACPVHYQFTIEETVLFDVIVPGAGFEFA